MHGEYGSSIAARAKQLVYANRRLIVVAVCLAIFGALLEDVLGGEAMRIDAAAYTVIVERLRTPWLTPLMESFSALATVPVLVVMLLMIVAFAPGKRPGMCCTVNLVLVALLNAGIKMLVQRPRPEGFRLVAESGFSFPSGHSMVSMAFFGLVIWFVWRYERDRRLKIALTVALAVVIAMVGISRIYLGVHYASDVIGGFCVSCVWLALYTRLVAPLFLRDGEQLGEER